MTAPEIPFRSLVAFEAAARLGSVSRAADELALTQSAVSQRVLKLEAHVGQRLFLREHGRLQLTAAGELLLESTRETLDRLQQGFERIAPYRDKASLLLGCPPGFARGWLMPRLARLREAHDAVEVWLMAEAPIRRIDRIDVDLIVSRRPLHHPDIECAPLLEDAAIAVCGPRTAERLAGAPGPRLLERAPLLFVEGEPGWSGLLAQPPWREQRVRRAATFEHETAALDAVEQDLGVGLLSRVLVADALARGRVTALAAVPPQPRERLWLMRSRLTPRTAVANPVFDWLRREAAAGEALPAAPSEAAREAARGAASDRGSTAR